METRQDDRGPNASPMAAGPDREGAIGAALLQIESLLTALEMQCRELGRPDALPFLGLARFELATLELLDEGCCVPVLPDYLVGEKRLQGLVQHALQLEPALDTSLRLLRVRGLLGEARTWADRALDEPRRPSRSRPGLDNLGAPA